MPVNVSAPLLTTVLRTVAKGATERGAEHPRLAGTHLATSRSFIPVPEKLMSKVVYVLVTVSLGSVIELGGKAGGGAGGAGGKGCGDGIGGGGGEGG